MVDTIAIRIRLLFCARTDLAEFIIIPKNPNSFKLDVYIYNVKNQIIKSLLMHISVDKLMFSRRTNNKKTYWTLAYVSYKAKTQMFRRSKTMKCLRTQTDKPVKQKCGMSGKCNNTRVVLGYTLVGASVAYCMQNTVSKNICTKLVSFNSLHENCGCISVIICLLMCLGSTYCCNNAIFSVLCVVA